MRPKTFVYPLMVTILIGLTLTPVQAVPQTRALPLNGKIAYEMLTTDRSSQIYLMEADGSNKTFLADGAIVGWSPDGTQLLLNTAGQLVTLDADKKKSVFPESFTGYDIPRWSPDGTRIATVVGKYDIYTVNRDGTGLKLIYNGPWPLRTKRRIMLNWSPDGKQLTFPVIAARITPYVIGADGKGLTVLSSIANFYPCGWSLDGRFIFGILENDQQDGNNKIALIEVKTKKVTELTGLVRMRFDAELNLTLSPDGKTLAYSDEEGNIFSVALAGGTPIQIVKVESSMDIYSVQWSPDGKQLVMECGGHFVEIQRDICIVNADGSNLKVLTESTEKTSYRSPAWQPVVSH